MDTEHTVLQLSALAQEARLNIFRALVEAGPAGLNPGSLVERVGVSQATLSFHLKELRHAQLINSRQEGRYLFYSANYTAMTQLIATLTENCCASSDDGSCAVNQV